LTSTTETKTVAGETQDIRGKILEYAWHLKKQGRKAGTIKSYTQALRSLASQGADLSRPDSVLETLALNEKWTSTTKATWTVIYQGFLDFMGLKWEKPKYKPTAKLPFIPAEQEVDSLIAGSPRKIGTLAQLVKETGARVGEALKVEWIDINENAQTVTINSPEKNSNPRILKVSGRLIAMLNALPRKSLRVFNKSNPNTAQLCLARARRRVAANLQNPRINRITFHTLRHWKATMEYHKTKDIIHVKQLLGHRKIENTMIYVNLEAALFQTENSEFHVKTAATRQEITGLLEVGFEYVCEKDGLVYLRKRK